MMRDSRQGANGAPSTLLRVDRFLVGRATLEGRLSYVNDAACAFFGRSADELIGQRYIDMVPAAEQATSRDRMRGVVQLARHVVAEMWLVNGNAERRCVQWVTFPEHSRDGEVVGYQVLGRDITELIAIRDALKRSERPPIADQLMFLVDAAGRFEGFHSEDSAPLFAPPKLFLGSMLEAALPPDLAIRSRVALGTTLAIGLPQTFDYTITEEQRTLPFRARAMRIDEQHALFVCFARHASEGNEGLLAALPDLVLRGHLGDDGSVDLVPAGGVAPLHG